MVMMTMAPPRLAITIIIAVARAPLHYPHRPSLVEGVAHALSSPQSLSTIKEHCGVDDNDDVYDDEIGTLTVIVVRSFRMP